MVGHLNKRIILSDVYDFVDIQMLPMFYAMADSFLVKAVLASSKFSRQRDMKTSAQN